MPTVKIIDRGFDRAIRDQNRLAGRGVKFGVQAGSGSHDGVDLLDIAIFNEFGTEHIPARPFMRGFADKNEKALGRAMDLTADKALAGKDPDRALDVLGEFAAKHQRAHVRDSESWAVANAPSTVKKKGSDVPLIDHGVLVNAIRHEKI